MNERTSERLDQIPTNLVDSSIILERISFPVILINAITYDIEYANPAALKGKSYLKLKCHELTHGSNTPCSSDSHPCPLRTIREHKQHYKTIHEHYGIDGTKIAVEVHGFPVFDSEGNVTHIVESEIDVTEHILTQDELRFTARNLEVLLSGARTVLENDDFETAARKIFDYCRMLTGAKSGYVALLSDDGEENEVLFLEAGGLPCTVDPELPMPIRGLREVAYRTGTSVFDNEFENSEWWDFLPEGHVGLSNVMFGPLVIEGKSVGLIGLANKPSDFTDDDAKIVTAFSEVAALALQRSWHQQEIISSTERYHDLFESISDGIIIADKNGQIIDVNKTIVRILELSPDELKTMTLESLNLHSNETLLDVEKETWPQEFSLSKKDGTKITAEVKMWVQENAIGELEGIYVSIHDITLEKMSKLQDELYRKELEMYTSLIRHDLGNDLQVITSALEISEMNLTDEMKNKLMQTITAGDAAVTRMKNLLEALSNPSEWAEGNIEQFFSRLISNANEIHPHMKFHLTVAEDMQTSSIVFSRLLPMVFENLIRNSAVYAGSNPQVTIDVTKEGDMSKIVFSDDGLGIPESIHSRTFEKGVSTTGGGMGLYLAKQICQASGGSISLSPPKEGCGAEFIIMMPII